MIHGAAAIGTEVSSNKGQHQYQVNKLCLQQHLKIDLSRQKVVNDQFPSTLTATQFTRYLLLSRLLSL
jgi:hypothetical protein